MKKGKMNKGAPSGVVISLIFHAAVFFIAGLFVVFSVVRKSEPEFVAPVQMERPKIKLKRPKVKVKKSSQPKPSSRIVAKVKTKQMPEIQVPDMMGSGAGLLGGMGLGEAFLEMPAVGEISRFGSTHSIGNDLVGTFYDFKSRQRGSSSMVSGTDPNDEMPILFRKFLDSGWNKAVFEEYYQSPQKLYASTVIIPECPSLVGPAAFGVNTPGYFWGVLYEGKLVCHKDIRFRFWGMGDNYIFVGVNGETVLSYWLNAQQDSYDTSLLADYTTRTEYGTPMTYAYGFNGKWIDLKAGEPMDLQVLIGESGGGASSFMLCVEVEGETYPLNPYLGGKTLPIFQTAVQSRSQVEDLERVIYPGDASVNEGPVFQDFEPRPLAAREEVPENSVAVPEDQMRAWTSLDGKTIRGVLFARMDGKAWIRGEDGRELKIPFDQFCKEDQVYLDLCDPPKLKLRFFNNKDKQMLPESGPDDTGLAPISIMDYAFGAEVKVISNRNYHYPLTVEYFAIGRELEDDNYVLWQRNSTTFTPSKENDYSVEFRGGKIRRISYGVHKTCRMRGEEYSGHLITVTDQRGMVIAYRATSDFLFEHLDALKKIPVTRHFDNECVRISPSRPIDADRAWAVTKVFSRAE
jgi:hypothetical protein